MKLKQPLHIYACCPKIIRDTDLHYDLGLEHGRLIGDLRSEHSRPAHSSWSGGKFSTSENQIFLEKLAYLKSKSALIDLPPVTPCNTSPVQPQNLHDEILHPRSPYGLAICNELQNVEETIVSYETYRRKKLWELEKYWIDQTAESLLSMIPNFIWKTRSYKLIDPYIFGFKNQYGAEKKIEILQQLSDRIASFQNENSSPIQIEVYGRPNNEFDNNWVQTVLSKAASKLHIASEINLRFFILKTKMRPELDECFHDPVMKQGIHPRYFIAGKYYWEFENSSADRGTMVETHWIKYCAQENERNFISKAFRRDSIVYDVDYSFSWDELVKG